MTADTHALHYFAQRDCIGSLKSSPCNLAKLV